MSLGGSEAASILCPLALNPPPSLPHRRGLGGGTQWSHFFSGPFPNFPLATCPWPQTLHLLLCPLKTPCSFQSPKTGHLNHIVYGTASSGDHLFLWTQGTLQKNLIGCSSSAQHSDHPTQWVLLAGPCHLWSHRSLSSRWSHGGSLQGLPLPRASISVAGLCFSFRLSSPLWTSTWINWTWRSRNWKPATTIQPMLYWRWITKLSFIGEK